MAYSKVILNGTTLVDLTNDTVTASDVLPGITAHKNDGTSITGSLSGVTINAPSSGTRSFSITVPNGQSSMITFVFTVDSSGNVTIAES